MKACVLKVPASWSSPHSPCALAGTLRRALWPVFFIAAKLCSNEKARRYDRAFFIPMKLTLRQAVARTSRRRALCWKNSAWLITAETFAGWNGLAIRKAGSGRSPVRKRSG